MHSYRQFLRRAENDYRICEWNENSHLQLESWKLKVTITKSEFESLDSNSWKQRFAQFSVWQQADWVTLSSLPRWPGITAAIACVESASDQWTLLKAVPYWSYPYISYLSITRQVSWPRTQCACAAPFCSPAGCRHYQVHGNSRMITWLIEFTRADVPVSVIVAPTYRPNVSQIHWMIWFELPLITPPLLKIFVPNQRENLRWGTGTPVSLHPACAY